MTEMQESGFMDLISDILHDNQPYSTKSYSCNGYYIKLFKETIIPNRAFRISYSSCALCTTSNDNPMDYIGIYWKSTHSMVYFNEAVTIRVISLEKTLGVPEAERIGTYLQKPAFETLISVEIDMLKNFCLNLFYNDTPISEEWDLLDNLKIADTEAMDDSNSVLFLLSNLADGQIARDTHFPNILEAIITQNYNIITPYNFSINDILLYCYGTAMEKKKATNHMLQYLMAAEQQRPLYDIWDIYKTWEVACKRFDSCTEESLKKYHELKKFADENVFKTTIVLAKKDGAPFSYTTYSLTWIVFPYGISISGNGIYNFDEIISIKIKGKTIYKRSDKK